MNNVNVRGRSISRKIICIIPAFYIIKKYFQVDNWFVKARKTKSNQPKNKIQDQKSNGVNVTYQEQIHVKNSAACVNKIESLQGKGATADPDDFISRKNHQEKIVKVENIMNNDDDKNNAVQDNQVSSTGQNNSPPSEFFKEDLGIEEDLGKYMISK